MKQQLMLRRNQFVFTAALNLLKMLNFQSVPSVRLLLIGTYAVPFAVVHIDVFCFWRKHHA